MSDPTPDMSRISCPETSMRLGRSDLIVSKIGVGAAAWGKDNAFNVFGSTDHPDQERAAFNASLDAGVTLFDTAPQYKAGNSEKRLGKLAHGSHAVIATKYLPSLASIPVPRSNRHVPVALDASLCRLKLDHIDLYQVHFTYPFADIDRFMDRMADAVEAGKVRAVGVSNFSAATMRAAHAALARRGIPLASNQIHYSLLYRRPEFDGMLDACRELEITPIAYMPMAMGLLTGKYRPGSTPTDWVRRRLTSQFSPESLAAAAPIIALLAKIGEKYGKTTGQVALRWIVEHGAIPIPGAKNERQAISNAGALTFQLTADEVNHLTETANAWVQGPKWSIAPRPKAGRLPARDGRLRRPAPDGTGGGEPVRRQLR